MKTGVIFIFLLDAVVASLTLCATLSGEDDETTLLAMWEVDNASLGGPIRTIAMEKSSTEISMISNYFGSLDDIPTSGSVIRGSLTWKFPTDRLLSASFSYSGAQTIEGQPVKFTAAACREFDDLLSFAHKAYERIRGRTFYRRKCSITIMQDFRAYRECNEFSDFLSLLVTLTLDGNFIRLRPSELQPDHLDFQILAEMNLPY
jgi:hypothetical protein